MRDSRCHLHFAMNITFKEDNYTEESYTAKLKITSKKE